MKKLKKFLITGAAVALIGASLVGCGNMTLMDTTYSFERVMLMLPNGEVVEGECTRWADFENSDMIQVTIDGKTYLTHSVNVVLISE
jgi:hypothetical protein